MSEFVWKTETIFSKYLIVTKGVLLSKHINISRKKHLMKFLSAKLIYM